MAGKGPDRRYLEMVLELLGSNIIAVISTPAATSMYADLMISACNIPGSARGKANAWCIAWGKPDGNALAVPSFSKSLWRNSASSTHGWGKV